MFFYNHYHRRKKGRRFAAGMAFFVALCLFLPLKANAEEPSLYATAAVLLDADTGRVLYEKNGDAFLANASTTKIMTCILALENASMEERVEASAYAAGMPKVKLYMKAGEHFKLGDLLYSLMLESHNDTAVAIAEHVGGSIEGFADMMNEKAKELGCENTCFLTPNGLDATREELSHGTTARDLARIMAYCAFGSPQKEKFLEITRTANYAFASEEGRSFSCVNHNAFLQMMEGALSGKTGFTNKAGYCYVGAFERDGKRFTIALLGCGWPNHKTWKWADSKELFSYGFSNYTYHSLSEASYDKEILSPVPVLNGRTEEIGGQATVEVKLMENGESDVEGLLLSPEENIVVSWEVKNKLTAPVEENKVIGRIRYTVGEECLKEILIMTKEEVLKIDFFWCLKQVLREFAL